MFINITSERIGNSNASVATRVLVLAHHLNVQLSEPLAYEQKTVAESLVLLMLYHHQHVPLANANLARELALSRASMTDLLERLRKDGVITFRADPEDRRRRIIVLTDAGKEEAEWRIRKMEEHATLVVGRLDPEARATFIGRLDWMTYQCQQHEKRRSRRFAASQRTTLVSRYA